MINQTAPPPGIPEVTLSAYRSTDGNVRLQCRTKPENSAVTWERDGVRLKAGGGRSLSVNVTQLPEGVVHVYRCAAGISHPDYPVSSVSGGVALHRPGKYFKL